MATAGKTSIQTNTVLPQIFRNSSNMILGVTAEYPVTFVSIRQCSFLKERVRIVSKMLHSTLYQQIGKLILKYVLDTHSYFLPANQMHI